MRFFAVLVVVALLVGCYGKAERETTLGDFKVEMLFEIDGARVYRFEDGGSLRYFVVAMDTASVSWRKSQGKTTVPVSISTVRLP